MRIGVITFSESKDNYGQILQCYALQKYLKLNGHSPFLIRYKSIVVPDKTGFKIKNVGKYLTHLSKYIKWFVNQKRAKRDDVLYQQSVDYDKRDFRGFIEKYIEVSSEIYDDTSIHLNPPIADAYICGSDQIWGGDRAYYLSFASDNSVKIAYAPSFGGLTSFSEEQKQIICKYVSRLDRIGMREQSGVETLEKLGIANAVKVVDPTLLLDNEDYKEIISLESVPSRRYAFIYLLGNPTEVSIKEIVRYVTAQGLQAIYVSSQGRSDSHPKINPTIEEWLGLISKADLVITNSFHCTVFSLIFEREFITLPLSRGYERMNTRIEELLSESNLISNFRASLPKDCSASDFLIFKSYKSSQQKISKDFLHI